MFGLRDGEIIAEFFLELLFQFTGFQGGELAVQRAFTFELFGRRRQQSAVAGQHHHTPILRLQNLGSFDRLFPFLIVSKREFKQRRGCFFCLAGFLGRNQVAIRKAA